MDERNEMKEALATQAEINRQGLVSMDPDNTSHRLLDLCLTFGSLLLESGAESARVEDTIVRVIRAFGKQDPSGFAIPTLFLITFKDEVGHLYTSSRRISAVGNNLHVLDELNNLSRKLCSDPEPSLDYFEEELERISALPGQSLPLILLAAICVSVGFTYLFGGSPLDALGAALSALIMRYFFYLIEKTQVNSMFNHLASSFLAGLLTWCFTRLGLVTHTNVVTIAVIMNLVPGMLMTNAIREVIRRDFTSGLSKMAEALLIAICLAIGTGIASLLLGGPIG